MSTSLSRLLSTANPALSCTRSEPLTRSVSNSVLRFICSSTQLPQSHQENPVKQQPEPLKDDLPHKNSQTNEDDDNSDDEDGVHVNKKTGEIGGPRGPEPTRYGDWEKNGRCYDF